MNLYIKKYRKVINELVGKSFFNLKSYKIFLFEISFTDYSAIVLDLRFFSLMAVTQRVRKYSKNELKGLFAHELSHIEIHKNRSFFKYCVYGLLYYLPFSGYVEKEEKLTDRYAIQKGYGKQLIALKRKVLKLRGKRKFDKNYLSIKEIKQYMKTEGII